MKEHDQVYLKVFTVEVEPENVIIVNYIGNKVDITDIAAFLNCHIDCINMDILLERLVHRKMQAYLETEGNRECKKLVKKINKFLDDHNYKSYYMQVCEDNGRLMIDVGSWSEFFYLEGMNFEEWSNNK